jgi:hypothetical protein
MSKDKKRHKFSGSLWILREPKMVNYADVLHLAPQEISHQTKPIIVHMCRPIHSNKHHVIL